MYFLRNDPIALKASLKAWLIEMMLQATDRALISTRRLGHMLYTRRAIKMGEFARLMDTDDFATAVSALTGIPVGSQRTSLQQEPNQTGPPTEGKGGSSPYDVFTIFDTGAPQKGKAGRKRKGKGTNKGTGKKGKEGNENRAHRSHESQHTLENTVSSAPAQLNSRSQHPKPLILIPAEMNLTNEAAPNRQPDQTTSITRKRMPPLTPNEHPLLPQVTQTPTADNNLRSPRTDPSPAHPQSHIMQNHSQRRTPPPRYLPSPMVSGSMPIIKQLHLASKPKPRAPNLDPNLCPDGTTQRWTPPIPKHNQIQPIWPQNHDSSLHIHSSTPTTPQSPMRPSKEQARLLVEERRDDDVHGIPTSTDTEHPLLVQTSDENELLYPAL